MGGQADAKQAPGRPHHFPTATVFRRQPPPSGDIGADQTEAKKPEKDRHTPSTESPSPRPPPPSASSPQDVPVPARGPEERLADGARGPAAHVDGDVVRRPPLGVAVPVHREAVAARVDEARGARDAAGAPRTARAPRASANRPTRESVCGTHSVPAGRRSSSSYTGRSRGRRCPGASPPRAPGSGSGRRRAAARGARPAGGCPRAAPPGLDVDERDEVGGRGRSGVARTRASEECTLTIERSGGRRGARSPA